MGILDTITPEDQVILDLYRHHQTQSFAVVVNERPDSPKVQHIAAEVEAHTPGYKVRTEYGFYAGKRATKLSMFPTEVTVQDAFMDGFERSSGVLKEQRAREEQAE